MIDILFLPKELEARNQRFFELLVPASGMTPTIEGEVLRAINKVIYRFYNDGDYWWKGYGAETAGPAMAFLMSNVVTDQFDIYTDLRNSEGRVDNPYIEPLHRALEKILDTIERRMFSSLTKNKEHDMLECEAKYEYDEEDDEEY
jgi:hypothetical protein